MAAFILLPSLYPIYIGWIFTFYENCIGGTNGRSTSHAHGQDQCILSKTPYSKNVALRPVLTPRFAKNSDVDILVDFEEGKTPGWSFATLHEELEPLWGHKVDLSTPKDFRPGRREQALAQARIIYGH